MTSYEAYEGIITGTYAHNSSGCNRRFSLEVSGHNLDFNISGSSNFLCTFYVLVISVCDGRKLWRIPATAVEISEMLSIHEWKYM